MARFQSGTLGRSVRRWSRFPKMGKFKKKAFSWQYVESEETALSRAGGTTTDIVILNNTDWAVSANPENVKNVSLDLRLMYAWSPEVTTLAYDSWFLKCGLFVLDADEVVVTLDQTFANHRAIWWNAMGVNSAEQPTALGDSGAQRWWNWTLKAKVRFMKVDDELRLQTLVNADITATVADLRQSIFGRISWETP